MTEQERWSDTAPPPQGLFDYPRTSFPVLEPEHDVEPARGTRRQRARRRPGLDAKGLWPWLLNWRLAAKVVAILFLLYGVVDTSYWLDDVTRKMAPDDPAAVRYILFAMYEVVRDAAIAWAIWLATQLRLPLGDPTA